MNIDHIEGSLEGKPCEIFFFESWGTYSHPVTPVRPLFFEQTLLLGKYYRAWMCTEGNERRFVYFEAVTNRRQAIEAGPSVSRFSVYLPREGANPPAIDRPLALGEIIGLGEYIAATPADKGQTALIRQKVSFSYRYRYKPDGSLLSATITNPEGTVSVLPY